MKYKFIELTNLYLSKVLQEKHKLYKFHNLLFVCKEWTNIIFQYKLYVGINKKFTVINSGIVHQYRLTRNGKGCLKIS